MTDVVWPMSMPHSLTAHQPLSVLPSFPLHLHPYREPQPQPRRQPPQQLSQQQQHRPRSYDSPAGVSTHQPHRPSWASSILTPGQGSARGDPATPVSPLGLDALSSEMPADPVNAPRSCGYDMQMGHARRPAVAPTSQLSYAPSRAATALPMGAAGMQFGRDRGDARRDSRRQSRGPAVVDASQHAPTDRSQRRKSSSGNAIAPALQIPHTINNSKGSLAEFAARITCLFWFESSALLRSVEDGQGTTVPVMRLVPEAVPTTGFRKWVTTILSTTQVTQNVILLALMFIYRLKNINPTVKGRPGSEFRLLTVALMLGNKFLDDNTYTNKTWAEVSGISVQEIHVMEVEFLSNMRYSLFVSEAQWWEWHTTLGRFWDYFEHASTAPAPQPEAPRRPSGPPTPSSGTLTPLPTPPGSTHASPPYSSSQYVPSAAALSHPLSAPPQLAPPLSTSSSRAAEVDLRLSTRKRSRDESNGHEPPPKKAARSTPAPHASAVNATAIPRLPTPNAALPAVRSSQDHHAAVAAAARLPHPGSSSMTAMAAHLQPARNAITPYGGDTTRRSTVYPASSLASPAPSTYFPVPATTSSSMSPSYILTHRSSPYRPVREVCTLLVPPQSGSTQTAPQQMPEPHMHYQPLTKARNGYRAGVVPYLQHDAWPDTRPRLPWMVPQSGQSQ